MRRFLLPLCFLPLLTGCGIDIASTHTIALETQNGAAIHGSIHGGHQAIAGSHIHLLAAGITGYASASTSLLTAGTAGTDTIGGYVTAAADGTFSITGTYTCSPGQELYLYGTGGNSQGNLTAPSNPSIGLVAALGVCPASGNLDAMSVTLNEVSTIALAYALAPFATDATHIGAPNTPAGYVSLQNAFSNINNLLDPATGTALATTPAGNGVAPQATVNTLANILAACVDTDGSVPPLCATLFASATSDGTPNGTRPSETATAALNIAHHPAANVAALYALITSAAPFSASLAGQPADLTLTLQFATNTPPPVALAIDAAGDVWFPYADGLGVLIPTGAPMRNSPFTDPSLAGPQAIAVDASDNIWLANYTGNSYSHFNLHNEKFDSAIVAGLSYPTSIAIDPGGNLWFTNYLDNSLTKLSNSGTLMGTFLGAGLYDPFQTLSDPSGNLWTPNPNNASVVLTSNSGQSPSPSVFSSSAINPAVGPQVAAIDAAHNLWILNQDSSLGAISTTTGQALPGTPFNTGVAAHPIALVVDSSTNLWTLSQVHTSPDPFSPSVSTLSGFTRNGTPLLGGHTFDDNMTSLAIDNSGNLWIASNSLGTISEVLGLASPVITPISVGVAHNTIATRP